MKRSLEVSLVLAAVTAATALITPAAGAAEPADASDCTTVLLQRLVTGEPDPQLVVVTYTPPATVTVSADGVAAATDPVVDWVDCVV